MSDLPLPDPLPTEGSMDTSDALDIQHDTDPEQDHGAARHIPHLGHAVLFFMLAFLCVLLCDIVLLESMHITTREQEMRHPLVPFLGECMGYVVALAVSWKVFPLLWQRSFLEGIHWTARAARRYWWQLVLVGFALSGLAQASEHLFKSSADSDVTLLLHTQRSAWALTLLGPTLAPLMEEIAFRGFLLPSIATAYDWLSLDRSASATARWQQSTQKTLPGLVFGAVMSSIGFALLHGGQLHWAKGPVLVLFVTSLGFSAVYVRLRSVAASTLVHVAYNGLIFLELLFQSGAYRHLDKLQ